jgi:lipopolysaccharide transport system permease protein
MRIEAISRDPLSTRLLRALNPVSLVTNLWHYRQLIRQLTWRDITGRYRSSMLGFAWSFITPLVSLCLYTFVFGVVFKSRWPQARTDHLAEFGLMLFAGITAFTLFSECANRSTGIIVSSPNYVKKVVFPLEILPITVVGSSLFHTSISLLLLLIAAQVVGGGVAWTALWLPIVFVPLIALALGVSWLLASVGVFFRDISHSVALITQVLFFLTPIFYPVEAVPVAARPALLANPLTPMVDNVRRVAVQGLQPDWPGFAMSLLIGLVVLVLGHAWFVQTKRAFADVI